MAVTACTQVSERWLDELILFGTLDNVGGAPIVESFTLPTGTGDVAILSLVASVVAIATVPTAGTITRGLRAMILSSDAASVIDVIGVAEWIATGGSLSAFDRVDAHIDPDALCLWRQGELLTLVSPEMDINAAPTADLRTFIKAVHVRPLEGAAAPLRLVR